jgi:group I intron endonuclease
VDTLCEANAALSVCKEDGRGYSRSGGTLAQILRGVALQKKTKICGIYKLIFPSGKGYVGQSRDITKRWSHYSYIKAASADTPVEHAIVKYGWHNVRKLVLCECDADDLNGLEDQHIRKAGTKVPAGYNLRDGGNAGFHHESTKTKMRETWAGKTEWTCHARKKQAIEGGKERIALDRQKVARNGMTAASNSDAAKAKRKATWDRKREEKLAKMDPEKAAKVRRQAVLAARRLQANGPPEGYAEYQAKRREEVREARRAEGWLG